MVFKEIPLYRSVQKTITNKVHFEIYKFESQTHNFQCLIAHLKLLVLENYPDQSLKDTSMKSTIYDA